MCAPRQILIPRVWHITEPSYNHLHLALQVLNTQYAQSIHNYFHLAHWISTDLAPSTYISKLLIYTLQKGPKHG